MSKQVEFNILYDGEALASHSMDVKDLAPALLSLGQLFDETNRVLNGESASVNLHIKASNGRHYWMEVDIQDDPRDPQRKIFYFYDVSEVQDLRRQLSDKGKFHDLIGKSDSMEQVFHQIQEIAKVDWTILIEGETGTGKELVARAIHASSNRAKKPFIALNCAGLTESLLSSQLFGHKRGSFTGALSDQVGLFEAANEGTLFLDEIGDIPMNMQTSLLRVLQEKEITRLGETKPRKIDVRVISATHRNLREESDKGNFRSDLLYRIRVARIQLPPLRERREDIPLLVGWYLGICRAESGKHIFEVDDDALRKLLEYRWPGNVRELKSAVEYAVIRCGGAVLKTNDFPPEILESSPEESFHKNTLGNMKDMIREALLKTKGNKARAAKLLGISRATLYRHLNDQYIQENQ